METEKRVITIRKKYGVNAFTGEKISYGEMEEFITKVYEGLIPEKLFIEGAEELGYREYFMNLNEDVYVDEDIEETYEKVCDIVRYALNDIYF